MGEKRINRCIELLEQGEYLYYTGAGPLTYENGKKQAKTWADFLMVDYEHSPFDVVGLRAFMQGWWMAVPQIRGTARRLCLRRCRPIVALCRRFAPMRGRSGMF